ncbi:hypothetical protein PLANTIT3_20113 [Plantibacter sp. T3]|nr:hypothetical protein PLANTIT3_20113 [Plantibacter sp. T3]
MRISFRSSYRNNPSDNCHRGAIDYRISSALL